MATATKPCDRNRPRVLKSWESGEDMGSQVEAVGKGLAIVQRVISRLEEDGADGHKKVPPMVILRFPELIKEAWHEDRLVPWRAGVVEWVKYLEYIHKFYTHCVQPTLHLALDRCLEMEEKYITSPAKNWVDMNLSKAIKERITNVKLLDKMPLAADQSAVAAAAFMCIAEEALLMSAFEESDESLVIFSDKVRRHAFNLMGYKGSKYELVCAALLGMKKEAEVMRKFLSEDAPNSEEEVVTSGSVRKHTLDVFMRFEKLFAEEISDFNPIKMAPTGLSFSADVITKRKRLA